MDYKAVAESDETRKIRKEFMNYLKQFPIPTPEKFDQARIEKATRKYDWPSHHPTMKRAIKNQDNWMHEDRRLRE